MGPHFGHHSINSSGIVCHGKHFLCRSCIIYIVFHEVSARECVVNTLFRKYVHTNLLAMKSILIGEHFHTIFFDIALFCVLLSKTKGKVKHLIFILMICHICLCMCLLSFLSGLCSFCCIMRLYYPLYAILALCFN